MTNWRPLGSASPWSSPISSEQTSWTAVRLPGRGQQIADYAETVGNTRIFAVERNHQQPGDPAKFAQALLQLADAAKPPLRLALGTDAVARIAEKNAFVAQEMAQWRALSQSTDFKQT